MMVLHKHKLIFLKARKTGGTSFEMALSKYADSGDIISPVSRKDEAKRRSAGFKSARNYGYSLGEWPSVPKHIFVDSIFRKNRLPRKIYNHMPASDVKHLLGDKVWTEYTKISIVRNPYDCLVSEYFWRVKKGETKPGFARFLRQNPSVFGKNQLQYMIDGEDIIDRYVRFENLATDVEALEKRIPGLTGLYETFSNIHAKGGIRPKFATAQEMFIEAAEFIPVVKAFHAFEIDRFGYNLD